MIRARTFPQSCLWGRKQGVRRCWVVAFLVWLSRSSSAARFSPRVVLRGPESTDPARRGVRPRKLALRSALRALRARWHAAPPVSSLRRTTKTAGPAIRSVPPGPPAKAGCACARPGSSRVAARALPRTSPTAEAVAPHVPREECATRERVPPCAPRALPSARTAPAARRRTRPTAETVAPHAQAGRSATTECAVARPPVRCFVVLRPPVSIRLRTRRIAAVAGSRVPRAKLARAASA